MIPNTYQTSTAQVKHKVDTRQTVNDAITPLAYYVGTQLGLLTSYPAKEAMPRQRDLSDAARVWNRACHREGTDLREGDRALGALLLVHGYIMNGGVGHAFELEPHELADGIAGYEFFGLSEVAAAIKPHTGEQEREFDSRYDALGGRDDKIMARFKEVFRDNPDLFAPLRET